MKYFYTPTSNRRVGILGIHDPNSRRTKVSNIQVCFMHMLKLAILSSTGVLCAVVMPGGTAFAQGDSIFRRNSCSRCSQCDEERCELCVVKAMETRYCYDVDHKTICVPKVKLPWQNCCEQPTAETKQIKVLNHKHIKNPICICKWKVVAPEPPQFEDANIYSGESDHVVPYENLPKNHHVPAPQSQSLRQVPNPPTAENAKSSTSHNDYFAPVKFGRNR